MLNLSHRKPELIVHSQAPFNAEPPLHRLRSAFVTPQRDFYVRSHGNVPALDAATHRLRLDGMLDRPLDLSMRDLREGFEARTVQAVLQCAGNRRADLQSARPTSGDPWSAGAIGNADWTGVPLADLLRAAGAAEDAALHVAFDSCDDCELEGERFRFGVSVPMAKALSPETLLAYEMNGEPLPPEHGFPLRAVVPGFAGVRSAKWLARITVQDRPSDNHIQQRDYKLLPSDITGESVDWQKGITIYGMPLNSAICEPAAFAAVAAGRTVVRGWAMATARGIARVDVSPDGGRHWQQASLRHPDSLWSWSFWEIELDLAEGAHELAVRAWDDAGQTQPASSDDNWNFKGYLGASWHRVPVRAG